MNGRLRPHEEKRLAKLARSVGSRVYFHRSTGTGIEWCWIVHDGKAYVSPPKDVEYHLEDSLRCFKWSLNSILEADRSDPKIVWHGDRPPKDLGGSTV